MILAEPEAVAAARTIQSLAGRACRAVPVAARCRVPRRLSSGMERQVWLAERRAALVDVYDAEAATLTMSGITGTCSGNGWPGCWV